MLVHFMGMENVIGGNQGMGRLKIWKVNGWEIPYGDRGEGFNTINTTNKA